MSVVRFVVPVLLLASAACGSGAVELGTAGAAAGSQWNATLASPSELAGVVQMTGMASMAPTSDGAGTIITLNLANASPGGMHPWQVRSGECGASWSTTTLGARGSYEPLDVDSDGRASSTVTINSPIPRTGRYAAVVHASAANDGTIVACGNLAPPTR